MYSRASQRPKFTAPFVSPTTNKSTKPSTQQRQLGREEKTQNDTHECYQGLKPKSPRRKLYTFKGPLDTLEVLQSGVGSSREKRYLIPPDKKAKFQSKVYEDVTDPVDMTSTCRPSAVGHVHQTFNGRSPRNKQDIHRKSAYNKRKGDKTMYSRASQRPKFTAPFVSPTSNKSTKPSTQQRQLGREEKTQNDTHECYQGLKPKSPRRKLYTFKGPLDTLEVLQSGVGSSREKRYLIPPDKKAKFQSKVYEDVTDPVDMTSTCRPSAVGHVHQTFNGRSPRNKQDIHRKSAYNKRKVKLDVLCSILKMKNELQIIHERREKLQDKIRHDHREEE